MLKPERVIPFGDGAVSLEFENAISPAVNRAVTAYAAMLEARHIRGVTELIPSYRALLVRYDPLAICYDALAHEIAALGAPRADAAIGQLPAIHIPVCYTGAYGPDLAAVADHCGLTPGEVAHIHWDAQYLIYMLGFTPGFPYLGGMDPRISAPRLTTPRSRIPGGSVGIAGSQTGIYPMDSPGGWLLIGRTPVRLYDPQRAPIFLLSPGQTLGFFPISEAEYAAIARDVESGRFDVATLYGGGN